jgi:hypothetical protein
MTITAPVATTARAAGTTVDPMRNHARAAGIFYLITFVSSIPALILLGPVLNHADYVTSAGQDTRVMWGCLLDCVNAFTAIGSAVALYPVVKRQNGSLALGFVTSRLMEAAVIMIGVVSLLAVVTMRQDRSRLVPRIMPTVGLIGAPLLLASVFAIYFGVTEQVSAASFFLTLPVAAWEFSIGIWMTFKGFSLTSPVLPRISSEGEQA